MVFGVRLWIFPYALRISTGITQEPAWGAALEDDWDEEDDWDDEEDWGDEEDWD